MGSSSKKQFGRVEQRLGEPDARLLSGRELAGRPVQQRLDLQLRGNARDPLARALAMP